MYDFAKDGSIDRDKIRERYRRMTDVLDREKITYFRVEEELALNPFAAENARTQCINSGLVLQNMHMLSIAPEFLAAVESYFSY